MILDGDKPEPVKFLRFLTDYCKDWVDIGLLLGLNSALLYQIEHENHSQRDCFRIVLEKWLQLKANATWNELELAITNARRQVLGYEPLSNLTDGKEFVFVWL